MEFKKKTIIWEDNNEPPKDYIWVKSDGKAYEFDYTDRIWKESKLIKAEESGSSDGSGSNSNIFFKLASIQPNRYAVFNETNHIIAINDIENLDLNTYTNHLKNDDGISLFYSKEEIAKLGISLEELEALECFNIDNPQLTANNFIPINGSIIRDNFIIGNIEPQIDGTGITVQKVYYNATWNYIITRYAYGDNNNYIIGTQRIS